jgi:DnaJ-class molecular chaperone
MSEIEWRDDDTQAEIEWLEFPSNSDYYETLEVSPHASLDVIKRAYRTLVEKYHPDKHPAHRRAWAEEKTKQLNEALSVLGDEMRRRSYDHGRTTNQV